MPDAQKQEKLKRGHGGARKGAGRPRKFAFLFMQQVGQACETLQRQATDAAVAARLASLQHADEIAAFQQAAKAIPVEERRAWTKGDGYKEHRNDIASWLHNRAGTPFDDKAGRYRGKAPRLMQVSAHAPRGTRTRAIRQVAQMFGLTDKQVENLWDAYRRFERSTADQSQT